MKSTLKGVMTPVTVHELQTGNEFVLSVRCLAIRDGHPYWSKELLQLFRKYRSNSFRTDLQLPACASMPVPSQLSKFDVDERILCQGTYLLTCKLGSTLGLGQLCSRVKWQLHFLLSVVAPDGVQTSVIRVYTTRINTMDFLYTKEDKLSKIFGDPNLMVPLLSGRY